MRPTWRERYAGGVDARFPATTSSLQSGGKWGSARPPNDCQLALSRRRCTYPRASEHESWGYVGMCFSATASFAAGAALLGVGTVTVSRVRRPAELLFAMIPGLFGVQQLIEGALWLTFPDTAPHANSVLTHTYSFFSHVLWPVYVPFAVLLLEPEAWRRKLLSGIAVAGTAVGFYLLYFLVTEPIVSRVVDKHIRYDSPHFYIAAVIALYVLATCVSSFVSSCKTIKLFGMATFIALLAAYAFYVFWFISVWCFFAAVLSVIVLVHFVPAAPKPLAR